MNCIDKKSLRYDKLLAKASLGALTLPEKEELARIVNNRIKSITIPIHWDIENDKK
jgi:hypothetical protein